MMVVVTIACCATTLRTQGNCCTRSPQFNLKQENCKIAVTPIDWNTHTSVLFLLLLLLLLLHHHLLQKSFVLPRSAGF